jgi:uncharacterized protein (DUF433 family)
MSTRTKPPAIDWSDCELVEVDPERLSGVPILKHTRIQADAIVGNFDSGSPVEEIEDNFGISQDTIRELLAYARTHQRSGK